MILLNQSLKTMQNYATIIYIEIEDVYEDIADDVGKRFAASSYEVNRPLPTGKNKKGDRIDER